MNIGCGFLTARLRLIVNRGDSLKTRQLTFWNYWMALHCCRPMSHSILHGLSQTNTHAYTQCHLHIHTHIYTYTHTQGCDFKASLSTDATIVSQDGSRHELPQQWVKSCWARLGHPNKIVKTKPIYSLVSKTTTSLTQNEIWCSLCIFMHNYFQVLYKGVPLLHFCEKYSLKQGSYMHMYVHHISTRGRKFEACHTLKLTQIQCLLEPGFYIEGVRH